MGWVRLTITKILYSHIELDHTAIRVVRCVITQDTQERYRWCGEWSSSLGEEGRGTTVPQRCTSLLV